MYDYASRPEWVEVSPWYSWVLILSVEVRMGLPILDHRFLGLYNLQQVTISSSVTIGAYVFAIATVGKHSLYG